MLFCYVDESGDSGMHDVLNPDRTGSPYFILVGLVIDSSKWKISLEVLKSFRKQLAKECYLNYDVEFHCSELIDPHKIKAYNSISVANRWQLIERYAQVIGDYSEFKILPIVIDKSRSKLKPSEYLTSATTKLYQAFDELLKIEKQFGLLFFDRANEKTITTHVRRLLGTGASGDSIVGIRISRVIEDPIFRISSDSIFIQSADVVAYTLKESQFSQASRKKYQADRIFTRKLKRICFASSLTDVDGIIRA